MEESTGKPTDDNQETMQENEDETRHQARNNTENTQDKQGKFDDALWPCHRSLMCDQYIAIQCELLSTTCMYGTRHFSVLLQKQLKSYLQAISLSSKAGKITAQLHELLLLLFFSYWIIATMLLHPGSMHTRLTLISWDNSYVFILKHYRMPQSKQIAIGM